MVGLIGLFSECKRGEHQEDVADVYSLGHAVLDPHSGICLATVSPSWRSSCTSVALCRNSQADATLMES